LGNIVIELIITDPSPSHLFGESDFSIERGKYQNITIQVLGSQAGFEGQRVFDVSE
jgi:hypothetical protein